MKFVQLTSPKNAGIAAYNASRSLVRRLYELNSDELFSLTPEVERVLDLRPKTQYTGSFALAAYASYQALFNDGRRARVTGRKPTRLICTYVITNTVNGKVYVGSTTDFFVRWAKHARLAAAGVHTNINFQAEVDKHGIDAFTITMLRTYTGTDMLLEEEERAGQAYDPELILNFRIGMKHHNGWQIKHNHGQGRVTRPARSKRGPQSVKRWFDRA